MSTLLDVVLPPAGRGPAVFVVHPWWGRNDTVRTYAERLAAQGFVVGVADAFEGDIATSRDAAQALLDKHWQAAPDRLKSAFTLLVGHPAATGAISALGFSFGGFQLLGLLSDLPIRRLVTYYADRDVALGAVPVLGHFAETDPYSDDQPGMIEKLIAAGPPSEAIVYPGTTHWFAESDRPEFDAEAANRAFERTVAFLTG